MYSAQAAPFIELKNAAFRLGERVVFPGTNWSFNSNEHWAVLGDNGSGKSLLADALRGQLPLVGGELSYRFRPPRGVAPQDAIGQVSFEGRKQQVNGAVVQSRWNSIEQDGALRLTEYLSYERVMEVNPFEVGVSHGEARARFALRLGRAVRLLQITHLLHQPLLCLSNGERQKAALARALCLPLRFLVLDEPFSGLDVDARRHFRHVLDCLMRTRLRVLLLSTRSEDLPGLITHALRVEDCRVIAAGPRREILGQSAGEPGARLGRKTVEREMPRRLRSGAASLSTDREAEVLVEMKNVTVRYGRRRIFSGVNWSVRAGESWAVLGPNGSGKTTLLGLITGDHPQAYVNRVRVFGCMRGEGDCIWEIKRKIGWVSAELHLHFDEELTAAQAVASGFHDTIGLFEEISPAQWRASRAALGRFGLRKLSETPLFMLSAGLQRLVLVARALVKNPSLLILDEPCQGLDAAHREILLSGLEPMLSSGEATAIYVTHRPEEIPPSIRRVLRLSAGQAFEGRLPLR